MVVHVCGGICVWVYMSEGVHVWGYMCTHIHTHMDGKGQVSEVKSLLPLQECEGWNLNSYPQAWWQVHLPTELAQEQTSKTNFPH